MQDYQQRTLTRPTPALADAIRNRDQQDFFEDPNLVMIFFWVLPVETLPLYGIPVDYVGLDGGPAQITWHRPRMVDRQDYGLRSYPEFALLRAVTAGRIWIGQDFFLAGRDVTTAVSAETTAVATTSISATAARVDTVCAAFAERRAQELAANTRRTSASTADSLDATNSVGATDESSPAQELATQQITSTAPVSNARPEPVRMVVTFNDIPLDDILNNGSSSSLGSRLALRYCRAATLAFAYF